MVLQLMNSAYATKISGTIRKETFVPYFLGVVCKSGLYILYPTNGSFSIKRKAPFVNLNYIFALVKSNCIADIRQQQTNTLSKLIFRDKSTYNCFIIMKMRTYIIVHSENLKDF